MKGIITCLSNGPAPVHGWARARRRGNRDSSRTVCCCRALASFLLVAGVVLGAASVGPVAGPLASAHAQDSIPELEERAAFAVTRGLEYLKRTQNNNGSWTEKVGRKVHMNYKGRLGEHVGVTALACMAFVSNGSLPGRGKYGDQVELGLDFILKSVQENGFITVNESRMYSHAFATLFLAEVYGMTGMENVRPKLKKCVELIVNAQNDQGGWRYLPGSEDADMSITVCQVMALRAARNAGVHVPKDTIDKAIRYVKNSFNRMNGSYYYQITPLPNGGIQPSRQSFALTAAGVMALFGAGEYSGPYIDEGLKYLRRNQPTRQRARDSFDYYYGMYYATQAFFQKGSSDWDRWEREVWRDLLALQDRGEGYWLDKVGPVYATSMACVILQIPYQYLPITER